MDILNVGVNDGHTIRGYGSGAVGIIKEGEHTRLVGAEVRKLLKEAGHNAINCTVDSANSVTESLSKIMDQANRQDLDWFISIHFNAGGGQGVEAYTYNGRQYQDAIDVCSNLNKLGFKNRGVKDGKGLYVIRRTKSKSMLIEVCFVDTDDANHYLQIGYKAIAKAIVEALIGAIKASTVKPSTYTAVKNGIVTASVLNIRSGASTNSSVVGTLKEGDKVRVAGRVGNFYSIFFGEHGAWVSCDYIKDTTGTSTPSIPTSGIVTATVLNVRSGAGTNYNIIGSYNKGDRVDIARKVGNFYETYFGDHGGWVSCDYIK